MNIDVSTASKAALLLVRLGIYKDEQIAAALVQDYPVSIEEARALVAEANEYDRHDA